MASQRLPSTSMLAAAWCNRLDQFCTQLQKSCASLHSAVQRKPEPESRGDNFDHFLEDLNDDVSSALGELQHLEERTTDTLSFEELLVHCDGLYKSNEDGIRKLELQLQQYGYIPVEAPKQTHEEVLYSSTHQEIETDSQNLDEATSPLKSGATLPFINGSEASIVTPMALSYETRNVKRDVQYSPLFGDLGDLENLESLGISATSLTALASQDEPAYSVHPFQHKLTFVESPTKEAANISLRDAEMENNLKTKYGSHWTSEAEIPSISSVAEGKFNSTHENDERHTRPAVLKAHVSEYGNGITNSAPTSTILKGGLTSTSSLDETAQSLGNKKVLLLDEVSSVQYNNLPRWLKLHVSLQELNCAITKINGLIRQRSIGGQLANQYVLDQEDVQALGLGSKARAGLMLLAKADKVVTQKTNGVTTYRVCI